MSSMQEEASQITGVDDKSKIEKIDVEAIEVEEEDPSITDDDEKMAEDQEKCEAIQAAVALEVRAWLEEHGAKLVALEWSKKDVRDKKAALKKPTVNQWLQDSEKKRDLPLESAITQGEAKRRRIGTRTR